MMMKRRKTKMRREFLKSQLVRHFCFTMSLTIDLSKFELSVLSKACSCIVTTPTAFLTVVNPITTTNNIVITSATTTTSTSTTITVGPTSSVQTTVTPVFDVVYEGSGCTVSGGGFSIGQDIFGLSTAMTACANHCIRNSPLSPPPFSASMSDYRNRGDRLPGLFCVPVFG